jgi:hypothetical protein
MIGDLRSLRATVQSEVQRETREMLKNKFIPETLSPVSPLYWLLLPSEFLPLIGAAMLMRTSLLLPIFTLVLLSGCERLGFPDPAIETARKEADARATGSACRHAGRGIEDCYTQNPDAARAPVYAGWKEMNDYMRENKIEDVKPTATPAPASAAAADEHSSASDSASAKSGKKSAEH